MTPAQSQAGSGDLINVTCITRQSIVAADKVQASPSTFPALPEGFGGMKSGLRLPRRKTMLQGHVQCVYVCSVTLADSAAQLPSDCSRTSFAAAERSAQH